MIYVFVFKCKIKIIKFNHYITIKIIICQSDKEKLNFGSTPNKNKYKHNKIQDEFDDKMIAAIQIQSMNYED